MIPGLEAMMSVSTTSGGSQNRSQLSTLVRVAIYGQLAAIVLTGLGVTYDVRLVTWPASWQPFLQLALEIGMVSWLLGPILFAVGLAKSNVHGPKRAQLIAIEVALVVTHLIALVPTVQ